MTIKREVDIYYMYLQSLACKNLLKLSQKF